MLLVLVEADDASDPDVLLDPPSDELLVLSDDPVDEPLVLLDLEAPLRLSVL